MKQVNTPAAVIIFACSFLSDGASKAHRDKGKTKRAWYSFEVNTSGTVDTVSAVTILNHLTFDRG